LEGIMMFWYGNGMGGWGYALMALSMIAFWGLVIIAIVALVQYLARGAQPLSHFAGQRPTPEELLAERFAGGEIDEQEYRQRLDMLRASARAGAQD
jgi:putative membrane protein